ncbi:MAG: GTP-binding protein [Myxococcota bacterium]
MRDEHDEVGLLRFATAGSVDDGKSTLIGRLLYDAKGLFEDQLEALQENFDLARITDGLRAEREQGITIDVAYRYFATPRRRFIIADCPGHTQYTRNALTGMSHADVAVLLVDARAGIQAQTRRHAYLASMLGLKGVVVCVNKMDLVDWSQARYREVEDEILSALSSLELSTLKVMPLSALEGANVTEASPHLDWYDGPTLLAWLENFESLPSKQVGGRLPVQMVLRPENGEGRSYAGRISEGKLAVGDEVVIVPRGTPAHISAIETFDGSLDEAEAPLSVSVRFTEEIDVSRGDLIATAPDAPEPRSNFDVTLACLGSQPLKPSGQFLMKVGAQKTEVVLHALQDKLDLESLVHRPGVGELALNDIGRASLTCHEPVAADAGGHFILIDPWTKETVAAGLIGAR